MSQAPVPVARLRGKLVPRKVFWSDLLRYLQHDTSERYFLESFSRRLPWQNNDFNCKVLWYGYGLQKAKLIVLQEPRAQSWSRCQFKLSDSALDGLEMECFRKQSESAFNDLPASHQEVLPSLCQRNLFHFILGMKISIQDSPAGLVPSPGQGALNFVDMRDIISYYGPWYVQFRCIIS